MASLREAEAVTRMTARVAAQPESVFGDIDKLFDVLVASEQQTLALLAWLRDPDQQRGPAPGGDIEFGFVLFWIHNPPPEIKAYIEAHAVLRIAYDLLLLRAPPTRITCADYAQLEADYHDYGEPGPDGTLYGFAKYQQLDPGWMLSALNYAANLIDPKAIHHPLPDTPPTIALTRKDGDTAKDPVLGIVGDWGTGYYPDEGGALCPAQRVIEQITDPAQSPAIDYLVHLGDVYYAGTDWRPLPGEEQDNFYDLWPDQGTGRNFTLNSNHEMYGAASGLFDVALQAGGKFAAQQGMSYYALTYGPWLVLCLDSAYYSDAYNGTAMYMAGAIGTAALDQQINWVESFRGFPGPIMVMTHHGAADTLTAQVYPLYTQVRAALGRAPTVWYWGHVHNGIVYGGLIDAGAQGPVISYATKGRCCGHGAIPFGDAWGLQDGGGAPLPNIDYYAHTPDLALPDTGGTPPKNPRVRNGYALVTLCRDGGFSEAFYETGDTQPMYQRVWTSAELAG